jgi:hypothetical protein
VAAVVQLKPPYAATEWRGGLSKHASARFSTVACYHDSSGLPLGLNGGGGAGALPPFFPRECRPPAILAALTAVAGRLPYLPLMIAKAGTGSAANRS